MASLIKAKIEEIKNYCKENGIKYLGIFGSYARGDFKEGSDVDILVRVEENKTLLDIVRMERELSKILGKKVDLLTEDSISKYIRDSVKKEVRTIYER